MCVKTYEVNLKIAVLQNRLSDDEILKLLESNSEKAIDVLFHQFYRYLCKAVYRIIPDTNYTEDIVQEVFYELWKKRARLNIKSSLKSYLRRAAVNRALNHIRDKKFRQPDEVTEELVPIINQNVSHLLEAEELKLIIDKVVDNLPDKCRIVFILNRFEEMTYKEIAETLNISIKTVENQISKALRILRDELGPYLKVLLFVLTTII